MTADLAVLYLFKMTYTKNVLILCLALLIFSKPACSQNYTISDSLKKIFLSDNFNVTDSEWILKTARESYFGLKNIEQQLDIKRKLNFVQNYSVFLLRLFNDLQTKDLDIYQLFSKENSFLKEYNNSETSKNISIEKLQMEIEQVQIATEEHLIAYYNTSDNCYNVVEILSLNESSFDAFLREKFRADYSDVGYFFLEVFATLIGLSWGIISTVLNNMGHFMEEH